MSIAKSSLANIAAIFAVNKSKQHILNLSFLELFYLLIRIESKNCLVESKNHDGNIS